MSAVGRRAKAEAKPIVSGPAKRWVSQALRRMASTSAILMIQDFPNDEGFRVAPGLVVVAAEGDEAIENDVARFHLDKVEFCPLHECTHLVKAADQEIAGAGRLRLAEQLIYVDVADRTGVWRAIKVEVPYLSARRQIGAQRRFEFAQASEMVGALIGHLAGSIDILDFGDRDDGRLALRPALPNRIGNEHSDGDQSEPR